MKLKMIALAAMLAAGSAHAAMDNSTSGNGSLYLSVYNGVDTSVTFDLGYNLDSFLPAAMSAPGISISWDLDASTLSNAFASLTYAGAWDTFAATVTDWNTVKYDVAAMDSTGTTAGTDRYLSTSNTPLGTVDDQTNTNLLGFSGVDTYVNTNNASGTHFTAANGAAVQTTGAGFYPTGKQEKWLNKATFVSADKVGTAQSFYMLATSSTNGLAKATVTSYAGTFNLSNAGVLTYATAPVPEASTYGMMLAGLGLVGFIARRRLAA